MNLRVAAFFLIIILLNTAWLAAFADPTIFYMTNVLAHIGLGLVVAVVWWRVLRDRGMALRLFLAGSLAAGMFLTVQGNTMPHRPVLWAHIALGVVFAAGAVWWLWQRIDTGGGRVWRQVLAGSAALALPAARRG